MRGFHTQPPGDAEAWERVYPLLAGPGKTVLWDNVPKLAGLKLQRVATRAYATAWHHHGAWRDEP